MYRNIKNNPKQVRNKAPIVVAARLMFGKPTWGGKLPQRVGGWEVGAPKYEDAVQCVSICRSHIQNVQELVRRLQILF